MPSTTFVISNHQTTYPADQVWVTFSGTLTSSDTVAGQPAKPGTWQSYQLSAMAATTGLAHFGDTPQYTFTLNNYNGRIYVNYGDSALSSPPAPGTPGDSPYFVFETTVTDSGPCNIDLSYVDGLSGAAGVMTADAATGAALPALSVNPITAPADILQKVVDKVPSAAVISVHGTPVRVMSASAAPEDYHGWQTLMGKLQAAGTQLKLCSYSAPATEIPLEYGLRGALFGYSGAPAIHGQAPGFDKAQGYSATAAFSANLNPTGSRTLTGLGIATGTAGVKISGSGTVSGHFDLYITEAMLIAGPGIYGNNPTYVVVVEGETAYSTQTLVGGGLANDLSGRIVGDLLAGIVFGWSRSTVNVAHHATTTGTNLYGMNVGTKQVSELSSGELFCLLSLAAAQGKLPQWICSSLTPNADEYDVYLEAVSSYTYAYASAFTDRLQGFGNPDLYWYVKNPPAIPWKPSSTFPLVGYVDLILGPKEKPVTGYDSIYIRDALGDTGQIPSGAATASHSLDIIPVGTNPLQDFKNRLKTTWNEDIGQDVVLGAPNYLYVRGMNRDNASQSGTFSLYCAPSGTLIQPTTFTHIGSVEATATPAGEIALPADAFYWANPTAPPAGQHYCLIATFHNDRVPDPMPAVPFTSGTAYVQWVVDKPNVAWRNIVTVPDNPTSETIRVDIANPDDRSRAYYFLVVCDSLPDGTELTLTCEGVPHLRASVCVPTSPFTLALGPVHLPPQFHGPMMVTLAAPGGKNLAGASVSIRQFIAVDGDTPTAVHALMKPMAQHAPSKLVAADGGASPIGDQLGARCGEVTTYFASNGKVAVPLRTMNQ